MGAFHKIRETLEGGGRSRRTLCYFVFMSLKIGTYVTKRYEEVKGVEKSKICRHVFYERPHGPTGIENWPIRILKTGDETIRILS